MKSILLFLFIYIGISSHAQDNDHFFPGHRKMLPLSDFVTYYPFYNGLQMIKIDNDIAFIQSAIASDPWDSYRRSSLPLSHYIIQNHQYIPPTYLFRDTNNKIVKYFNVYNGINNGVFFPNLPTPNYNALKQYDSILMRKEDCLKMIVAHQSKSKKETPWYYGKDLPITSYGAFVYYVNEASNPKHGLIDTFGNYVLQPVYDEIIYKDSQYAVKLDGKWGVVSAYYSTILKPQYAELNYYRNNRYRAIHQKKYGIVSGNGEIIVDLIYDEIIPANKDTTLFLFTLDKRKGLMNADFNIVQNADYSYLSKIDFRGTNLGGAGGYLIRKGDSNAVGLLDSKGKEVLPVKYDRIEYYGGNYYFTIRDSIKMKQQMGVVDSAGKELIPAQYDYVSQLQYNKFIVANARSYGLVKVGGKEIIPPSNGLWEGSFQFFKNGITTVKNRDNTCIILDAEDKIISNDTYQDAAYLYIENYFGVQKAGDGWGIMDMKGNLVIPCNYQLVDRLNDKLFKVMENDKWYVVNKSNKQIVPNTYNVVTSYGNNIIVVKDGKYGLLDSDGKELISLIYDHIYTTANGLAMLEKDEKFGLADSAGKIVAQVIYEQIQAHGKIIPVKKEGYWGCINSKGKLVLTFEYTSIEFIDGLVLKIMGRKVFYMDQNGTILKDYQSN